MSSTSSGAPPGALGRPRDPLAHALEVHTDLVHRRDSSIECRPPRGRRPTADASGSPLRGGQRGDGGEAAAVALAVGVEQISGGRPCTARGFSIRAGSTPASPSSVLVGLPTGRASVPGAGRRDPALPARGIRAQRNRDHGLVHLVAAGTDRGRDGGVEPARRCAPESSTAARTAAGAAPRTVPRQPTWATASARAIESQSTTARQSAVKIASGTPRSVVVSTSPAPANPPPRRRRAPRRPRAPACAHATRPRSSPA